MLFFAFFLLLFLFIDEIFIGKNYFGVYLKEKDTQDKIQEICIILLYRLIYDYVKKFESLLAKEEIDEYIDQCLFTRSQL